MVNFKVPLAWCAKVSLHCHMKYVHVKEITGIHIAKFNVLKNGISVATGGVAFLLLGNLCCPFCRNMSNGGVISGLVSSLQNSGLRL